MVMSTYSRLLSKAVFATLVACSASFAGTVSKDLNALSGNSLVQVIVGLKQSQAPASASMVGVVQMVGLQNTIVAQ